LVIDAMSLFSAEIDGQQLSCENAGDNTYHQARVYFVWFDFVIIIISFLFDTYYDTILFYYFDEKRVDRSAWTIEQLKQENYGKNTTDLGADDHV
jgi:hypothetical protein